MSVTTEELREKLGYALALHFSGDRMPHMSGDPRNKLSPFQRRNMEDAITSILQVIGPVEADARIAKARRDALEEAAQWHDEQRESSESGLEYSSLVGIPIANATDLRSSAKTHEWCAAVIRALGEKE